MPEHNPLSGVSDYLRARFPGADIVHRHSDAGDSLVIDDGAVEYTVIVDPDFLESKSPAQVIQEMEKWQVEKELRRTEGLPLTISPTGLRLASSN